MAFYRILETCEVQKKQETFGISALKGNSNVITDSLSKAEILYSLFKSVFTAQFWKYISPVAGYSMPQN